jgi:hypothetical protein
VFSLSHYCKYIILDIKVVWPVTEQVILILNFQKGLSGDGELSFGVSRILVHPLYNASNTFSNDFAILTLSSAVPTTNPNVGIVCLPPDVSQKFAGEDNFQFIHNHKSVIE